MTTWTLTNSGAAKIAAGKNYSTDLNTSLIDTLYDEVEDYIVTFLRYDVATNWNSLTSSGKNIIQRWANKLIGQDMIEYDMSGYTTGAEADQMLNKLENDIVKIETLLKEDKYKTFLAIT